MKILIFSTTLITLVSFVAPCELYSQEAEVLSYNRADSLIKSAFGPRYSAGSTLDVDSILVAPRESSQWKGYIFEDPRRQLQHCLIVAYGKWDSLPAEERYGSGEHLNDSGGIALIKADKIVWYSKRVILQYSEIESRISGFADLNDDGITDIIYSRYGGSSLEIEFLWLISPNNEDGSLLNGIDSSVGFSTIVGGSDTFEFRHRGNSIIISAIEADSEALRKIHYRWNGKKYVGF